MSARSFRSVFMVASCAGAALGCYLVSLNVASERAALEDVETEIVLAQRDIRLLQTEIGTRGRLAQLERWNVKVLALSAPSADQFVNGGFELARMVTPERKPVIEAPVVLASAPAEAKPRVDGAGEADAGDERAVPSKELLYTASLKRELPEPAIPVKAAPAKPEPKAAQPKPGAAKTPPAPARISPKKSVDKTASAAPKPVTKPARLAKNDPLAPLPAGRSSKAAKDSGTAR